MNNHPREVFFEVGRAEFDALSDEGVTGIPAKPFFVCRHDMSDDRVYQLSQGTTWWPVDQAGVDEAGRWRPDVEKLTFVYTTPYATQRVSRQYLGMEFTAWAPGWCFLRLGERPAPAS